MTSTRLPSAASPSKPATAPVSVEALFPTLYNELRRLAGSLLDTSTLVHEAYLRMQRDGGVSVANSEHFMAYAATTMRSIVIDFVRRRGAERRGGGLKRITLDTVAAEQIGAAADEEILAVHEALESLSEVDARLVRVVEMRYFAGLTEAEIAAALGITDRTVRRDWSAPGCCWRRCCGAEGLRLIGWPRRVRSRLLSRAPASGLRSSD
jgi:RNA polymerase sigma factor (TIGR02999 family)